MVSFVPRRSCWPRVRSAEMLRGLVALCGCVAIASQPVARADAAIVLNDLVDAAVQRLQVADPVAANKWLTGGPLTDPPRVRQVLDAVSADAQSVGVSTDYVRTIFTDQINATEAIEYSRFADWKFGNSAAPTTAPDLAASRSLIDGLNRTMVSEIAAHWPLLNSPGCAVALEEAKTVVAQARQLDPLFREALDTATRSYCQA